MRTLPFGLQTLVIAVLVCSACTGEQFQQRTIQVSDGNVLIVGAGDHVGLIKIVAQTHKPEAIDYHCAWRDDGIRSFVAGDVQVKHKSATDERDVRFGPFVIGWSVEGSGGKGWLYFDRFPGGEAKPKAMRFLITAHSEIKDVRPDEIEAFMKKL